jgi:hypothetical protein
MSGLSEAERVDTLPEALTPLPSNFPTWRWWRCLSKKKLKAQRIKLTKRDLRELANGVLTKKAEIIKLRRRTTAR